MNNLERAEKIWKKISCDVREFSPVVTSAWKDLIAAKIEEACAEAVKEDLKMRCFCMVPRSYVSVRCRGCHGIITSDPDTHFLDDFKKGFAAARGQANGIALEHCVNHRDSDGEDLVPCKIGALIAAMKPEQSETPDEEKK